MASLDWLTHNKRINAVLGWVLTGAVALAAVESVLMNDLLWGGIALALAVVTVVPALSTGDWTMMPPWPLPLVASVAVLVRALGLYLEVAGYLAIVTFALVAVVELDAFTPVEMSRRFAVVFAVLTTMAVQGLWTVAQFYSDRWFETEYLRSQTELQWDFVIVSGIGLVVGAVFVWYFNRVAHVGSTGDPMSSTDQS